MTSVPHLSSRSHTTQLLGITQFAFKILAEKESEDCDVQLPASRIQGGPCSQVT